MIRTLGALDGVPRADVFPGEEPKTIKRTLPAGGSVPAHSHPGRHTALYLLEGRIELPLDDETRDVSAGDVARFEGERDVSTVALDDSVALVVLAGR